MAADIIVTTGVAQYRQTVPVHVNGNDTVLEVGCATGTTSVRIYQRAKYLVAVEKGPMVENAKRLYPDIHFERIDAANVRAIVALGFRFNKIYLDISGSAPLRSLVPFIEMYEGAFHPELIVIKNDKLRSLIEHSVVWEPKMK